jgi:hypothetical protein
VRRQRDLMAGYAVWLLLLALAYYLLPGLRAAAWTLIGLTGADAIVAGLLGNRPGQGCLLSGPLDAGEAGELAQAGLRLLPRLSA